MTRPAQPSTWQVPGGAVDCHAHVFDPARFPYSAGRSYTPPPATAAQLLRMQDRLGLARVVLVQPSVYGTDNRCLLDALAQLGSRARGVAVVGADATRAQLEDLHAAGVRGLRLNHRVGVQAPLAEPLERLALQVADLPLLIQVYAAESSLLACAPLLRQLPQRLLLDHFAMAGAQLPSLCALLSGSRVVVKLSGPHQLSRQAPDYADVTPIAQALAQAAPDRVVWGSDWPHTGGGPRNATARPTDLEPFRTVDDAHELGLLAHWLPDPDARRCALVDTACALFGFDPKGV